MRKKYHYDTPRYSVSRAKYTPEEFKLRHRESARESMRRLRARRRDQAA